MKVALVGATGMVGSEMIRVLEESNLFITEFIPVASAKSIGKQVILNGKSYSCISLEDAVKTTPDIALFSAGGHVSLDWAPKFAAVGTYVIDNSSAWRMDKNTPLVVPEINAHVISPNHRIIANPNCSTIQLVMALKPIHVKYGIKRLVISTYQSVSGTGYKAVNQLNGERTGKVEDMAYPHQIDKNCIPHCDDFLDSGYTKEEMKMVNETKKILEDDSLRITATAVRVPVDGGHSESVNLELHKPFEIEDIIDTLANMPGVVIQDDVKNNKYPMPLMAKGKNEVFIGRIRKDDSADNAFNMWIVADNLRKGAATNAVQIAEYITANYLIQKETTV
ncbi:MAG: aspartate-semialdehyde dehydrogenase [Bacteroidia bacterium]|jgi:aspartate-semialdehyde dehydrogenase